MEHYIINQENQRMRACGEMISSREKENSIMKFHVNFKDFSILLILMKFRTFGNSMKVYIMLIQVISAKISKKVMGNYCLQMVNIFKELSQMIWFKDQDNSTEEMDKQLKAYGNKIISWNHENIILNLHFYNMSYLLFQ